MFQMLKYHPLMVANEGVVRDQIQEMTGEVYPRNRVAEYALNQWVIHLDEVDTEVISRLAKEDTLAILDNPGSLAAVYTSELFEEYIITIGDWLMANKPARVRRLKGRKDSYNRRLITALALALVAGNHI